VTKAGTNKTERPGGRIHRLKFIKQMPGKENVRRGKIVGPCASAQERMQKNAGPTYLEDKKKGVLGKNCSQEKEAVHYIMGGGLVSKPGEVQD